MAHPGSTRVIVGVDTHKDLHVARAKDELGRGLGEMRIPASLEGYGLWGAKTPIRPPAARRGRPATVASVR